jgi:hypothetical protein
VTEAVTETVAEAATEAAVESVADASVADLLTTDGFDLDKVTDLISGSDLDTLKKTALTEGVKAAMNNPELLQAALDQVKSALGM